MVALRPKKRSHREPLNTYRVYYFINMVGTGIHLVLFVLNSIIDGAYRGIKNAFEKRSVRPLIEAPYNIFFLMCVGGSGLVLSRRFEFKSRYLRAAQERLLLKIVEQHRNTDFGKDHRFDEIHTVDDFRERVPVQNYNTLHKYVEKHICGEPNALVNGMPTLYATTSGTTGEPKYIPITKECLKKSHQGVARLWSYYMWKDYPHAFHGKIFPIVSPAVEGYTPASVPYGSASGQLVKNMSPLFRKKYALPYEVYEIDNYDARYYAILRIGMTQNVTLLSSANPSTLVLIAHKANEWREMLIDDIRKGAINKKFDLESEMRKTLEKMVKPNPGLAKRLEEAVEIDSEKCLRVRYYWPNLALVSCWTGGSSGVFLKKMEKFYGRIPIRDIGYLASELRGSIPVWAGESAGPLTIHENFFEFVEASKYDTPEQEFKLAHELEEGKLYYIFVTTRAGLYRYNINDIIEVKGFWGTVPSIVFVQKGKGVTNITGEKLYEEQLMSAVQYASQEVGAEVPFFMGLALTDQSKYELYAEFANEQDFEKKGKEFIEKVEEHLCKVNIEYHAKRKSLRLKPIGLRVISQNSFESFKQHRIADGLREAQIKAVPLTQDRDLVKCFEVKKEIELTIV